MPSEMDQIIEIEEEMDRKLIAGIRSRLKDEGCNECEDCGEPIPDERRQALPSARTCIICQEKRERK